MAIDQIILMATILLDRLSQRERSLGVCGQNINLKILN